LIVPSRPLRKAGVGMRHESVQKFGTFVSRVAYFSVPTWLIYLYVIALSLAYVLIVVHTPITLYPGAPHDDGLFMSLGRSLAEGRWLGPYTEFTLMKGPGYPAFLAVAKWLGISVSLAHALFYCAAVIFFVAVAHRIMKSYLLSGILLALLFWQLLPTTVYFDRIIREQIYGSQVLALFAAATATLFLARAKKHRLLLAALAGLFLGWLWLTRAEGAWILPAAILLTGAAAYRAYRLRRLRELAEALVVVIAVFASIQIGFRTVNWGAYGKFVGVDFDETNFQRALRAIDSVRSGGIEPFISVTKPARDHIYDVSPSFASLRPYFEGSGAAGWEKFTCDYYPRSCEQQIAAGWFVWALRAAASMTGHYSSPAEASAFFGRIADEISTACARGALTCEPQFIAEMPPVNWADVVSRMPSLYAQAFDDLLLIRPPLQFNTSSGSEAKLDTALRFLNYPLYTRSIDATLDSTYSLSGWYYKSGRKWLWGTIKAPDGSWVNLRLERHASPDLQAASKDPEISHQRFVLSTRCSDECTLELHSQDDEIVQKKLSEFRHGPIGFSLGEGHVHVDSTTVVDDLTNAPRLVDVVSGRVRQAVLNSYAYVLIPVLVLGIIFFLVLSLRYWRRVFMNVSYIMALCSWTLIVVRVSLLVLIAATSFPAVSPSYLWPAQLLLVSGALFSLAAWFQLSARAPA
jgi:hypothetical protein